MIVHDLLTDNLLFDLITLKVAKIPINSTYPN